MSEIYNQNKPDSNVFFNLFLLFFALFVPTFSSFPCLNTRYFVNEIHQIHIPQNPLFLGKTNIITLHECRCFDNLFYNFVINSSFNKASSALSWTSFGAVTSPKMVIPVLKYILSHPRQELSFLPHEHNQFWAKRAAVFVNLPQWFRSVSASAKIVLRYVVSAFILFFDLLPFFLSFLTFTHLSKPFTVCSKT